MTRKTYGVPYSGSKNKLAEDIIDMLPAGNRLVDLFAGGGAMTHCALLSGKWESILSNDLYPLRGQTLFRKAAEGEYLKEDYYRIVSKQEFNEKRDKEPHMVALWGWNGYPCYLGQPWYDDVVVKRGITDLRYLPKDVFDPTHRLARLQRLAGLDLSNVEFRQMDYTDYQHEDGDVVYCDPPYANTDASGCNTGVFDSDSFWEWVRTREYPVYVSEYNAPEDFVSIWSKLRRTTTSHIDRRLGQKGISNRIEHIFVHIKWLKQGELQISCR